MAVLKSLKRKFEDICDGSLLSQSVRTLASFESSLSDGEATGEGGPGTSIGASAPLDGLARVATNETMESIHITLILITLILIKLYLTAKKRNIITHINKIIHDKGTKDRKKVYGFI